MTNAEIQVGEYVRTTSGFIAKCIEKDEYNLEFDDSVRVSYGELWSNLYPSENDIVKHSFNLIDLIEEGDYVKLYYKLGNKEYIDNISSYVCNVGKSDDKSFIELDYGQDGNKFLFNADKIKTIVTHEQFKAMEYKVGEA